MASRTTLANLIVVAIAPVRDHAYYMSSGSLQATPDRAFFQIN